MSLKAFHIIFVSVSTILCVGFGLWGEWPDPVTFAGISILVAAGLYTLYREQQLKRARARTRP